MKGIFVSVLIAYVLLCLALAVFQRKLLYFPQPADPAVPVQPVSFHNGDVALRGWVVNPDRDRALLYYGGNAEHIEYNVEFFQSLLPEYTVYLVPYRGYGDSDGEPTEAALYSDALHIYDRVRSDHAGIALMGRSLGSGIATYVAARREVDRLVLITPYDSIENVAREAYWMFPISLLLQDKYHSYRRLGDVDAPVLVLIAGNDRVISRARSEALIGAFDTREQVDTVVIENAGHNDISAFPRYGDRVRAFLVPPPEPQPAPPAEPSQ